MPNPKPKLENLKPFARRSDRELGKIIGTRFPVKVEAVLRELPDKQAFIRQAVEERLIADGLMDCVSTNSGMVDPT